jgi:hypothetical protein
MNLLRSALGLFYKFKYSMLISGLICAPIMTIYQIPSFPRGVFVAALCGQFVHNFTCFAAEGLFGAICSFVVLMWNPNARLLALLACFLIPFTVYGIANHIVPTDTSIFAQMLKAPISEIPGYLKYELEALWTLCLPGLIGGIVIMFSTKKSVKQESIPHLECLDDSHQILKPHEEGLPVWTKLK